MENKEKELFKKARETGFHSSNEQLHELAHWLREEKQIHVEVGSIWDELTNFVESYCYTVTSPIHLYYTEPIHAAGGKSYNEMLYRGLAQALALLEQYDRQKHLKVSDDQVVIAYLKGYGDKDTPVSRSLYQSNLEKYAYRLGKQGDYIEEGLTEEDIVVLVRNTAPNEEMLNLE